MRCRPLPLIGLAALLGAAGCATRPPGAPPSRPELRYYVEPAQDPSLLQVTLVAERIESDSLELTFPLWLPGDFQPIEPGKWVEDVRAFDRSTATLPVRRLGENRWRVYPRKAPYFLIRYTLHPVRPDGFKRSLISELAPEGGYFTGAVALGYLKGLENYPSSLTFELPAGTPAICSLDEDGPARFAAPGYYELSQAACAYGRIWSETTIPVRGVPHRLVLRAPGDFEPDSLVQVVREVSDALSAVLGRAPYPEYTLFVRLVDPTWSGLGGSPLFRGSAYYLPEIRPDKIRHSGIPFLFAHQLVHAWNLWAFPPAELSRPRLDAPVSARALWWVEGFADHFGRLALARRGVLPREEVYDEIARNLRALTAESGAEPVNLETAGVAAGRQPDREAVQPLALKSALAALAVDVELRRASANAVGADSMMRWLEAATHASPEAPPAASSRAAAAAAPSVARAALPGKGVPYDSIVSWLLRSGGADMRSLYASAIAGNGRLPYPSILAGAGLDLENRQVRETGLGASLVPDGVAGFVFRAIQPGGLADKIGVEDGDRLVSVNGQTVEPGNLLPILAVVADLDSGLRAGEPFRLEVERSGIRIGLEGVLSPWTHSVPTVVEAGAASTTQAAVREGLFAGTRGAAATAAEAWPAERSR